MATQPQSMILDMLKTPQQVREEQLAKIRQQSAAQAQILAQPVRGTTALPGLLSRFAAGEAMEQRVDLDKAARRAAGALGSTAGMLGYAKAESSLRDALKTPEERLAGIRQSVMKGVDVSNSNELIAAAKRLSDAGDTQGAASLQKQAQQVEKAAADIALTQAQVRTEASKEAANMAKAGLDAEKIRDRLAKRGLEIDNLELDAIVKQARADNLEADTKKKDFDLERLKKVLPGELSMQAVEIALTAARANETSEKVSQLIQQAQPNLDKAIADAAATQALAELRGAQTEQTAVETKQAKERFPLEVVGLDLKNQATAAGITLDQARVNLVNSQVTTEEVTQRAQEAQISITQAREELVKEELSRYIQMTPSEVLKSQLGVKEIEGKIAQMDSQTLLNRGRLADIGQTEFTRELNTLVESGYYTPEQAQALVETRLQTIANKGSLGQVITEDRAKTTIKNVSQYVVDTAGSSKRMQQSMTALSLIKDANTGNFRSTADVYDAIVARAGSFFGMGKESLSTVQSNELLEVLLGDKALENASSLKGALSDRDLAFVRELAGNRNMKPEALVTLFQKQYAQAYAENQTAMTLEAMMADMSPQQIATFNYGRVREDVEAANRILGAGLFKEEAQKYGLDVYTDIRERAAQQ
jgi:hypothetical protein